MFHNAFSLPGAGASLAIAEAMQKLQRLALIITADTLNAERVQQELAFFLGDKQPILRLPDWEILIYDSFSPHRDIISDRLSVLNSLALLETGILILPMNTLMQRIAPRHFILGTSLILDRGQEFNITRMRQRLQDTAYHAVDTVLEHGEYAVRGSIMDIFPMGSELPYRVDLLDDKIDSLRTFDPETQKSIAQVERIRLLPAREFPLTRDSIRHFQDQWFSRFSSNVEECPIYRDVAEGLSPAGVEYYLPLFFDELETLFDYLPDDTLLFCDEIEPTQCWQEANNRYESLRHNLQKPILPPGELLLPPEEVFANLKNYPQTDWHQSPANRNLPLPELSIKERSQTPLAALADFIGGSSDKRAEGSSDKQAEGSSDKQAEGSSDKQAEGSSDKQAEGSSARLLVLAESNGRREIIDALFRRHGLVTKILDSWQDFITDNCPLGLAVASLERGLLITTGDNQSLAMITEQQLFGDRVLQKRRRERQRENITELTIKRMTELGIGSAVTHIDHGVGRYQGLQTLNLDGQESEFLVLLYQGAARLYVPVSSLHLISRYAGAEAKLAPLDRLGGEVWQKAKRRAAEQIQDVAAMLLDIYARREAKTGFSYPVPDEAYDKFVRGFPFEETPDQSTAIDSVIADLVQEKAMDRLICGDVGFGKTEVAMRATFIAVQSGKQVALIAPTTLLALQHTETFKDRFADWPVNIDSFSRFKTKKQQKVVIEKMASGQIDILIGTHALIQDRLVFKNLGLLIIDEEHKFGVRQKEKLKSLRAEVDILTLTATPIPRTLNMAISGMRDISIIATPPNRRLSIKTFVRQHDKALIKEAIQRELMRGGQVYYLHNDVRTIEETADRLQALVPQASIVIGHGQMRERELEQVMSDFYHKRANLLVCSTIIESGIDIPNANTIIMDRADNFGLAQLHQLRGRVGRSHHQAYAWLLTPPRQALSADAKKRLDAISDAEELGSGFILATHDLEIRGAGELLGDAQTGNIQTIGYSLYMEMLNRAVQAIRSGKIPNLDRPLKEGTEINMHLPALIPASYLPDVHTRLVLYKRISNAEHEEQLQELQVEMIDRFGTLPEACKMLFRIIKLKLRAEALGIKKVDVGDKSGKIEFTQETSVDPASLVRLIQSEPHRYRLGSANQLVFNDMMEEVEARFEKLEGVLEQLGSGP